MFQVQQGHRKERNKLALFSAPANMLSFRPTSGSNPSPAPSATSSSRPLNSNPQSGPSSTSNNTSATMTSPPTSVSSHNLPPLPSASAASVPSAAAAGPATGGEPPALYLPSMDKPQEQYNPSLVTPSPPPPTHKQPNLSFGSPSKKQQQQQQQQGQQGAGLPAHARTLTAAGAIQRHHTAEEHKKLGPAIPTSAYVATLPGPASSLADLPKDPSTNSRSSHQHHQKNQDNQDTGSVPQSRRPPQDPFSAPGVSFRSSLKPPASAQIPDIPYGEGQTRKSSSSSRRPRGISISSSQATGTGNGAASAAARMFTPSDAHTNIRVGEETPTNKAGAISFTGKNAAGSSQPTHTIVASSPAQNTRASAVPKGTLITPAAPLTVNAPVVPTRDTLVTSLDPQHLENFQQATPPPNSVTSPSKQPAKSALKGRSWADLVRPANNHVLAQEAVKNIGLHADQVEKKKRVSIALPAGRDEQGHGHGHGRASGANQEAGDGKHSPPISHTQYPRDGQVPTMRVPTHSPVITGEGNDKSPHHYSPPPPDKEGQSEQDGEGYFPDRAPSVISNTNTTASSGSTLLSNMMAKKRNLEELLAGVENSSSRVVLYPRGLVNTGNACFMNSILQTLLFIPAFYNLISLIGTYTTQDFNNRTPLLDAMVSYMGEFKTGPYIEQEKEAALNKGESYDEPLNKSEAFIPSIIYHALNHNARFSQMGFSTGIPGSGLFNGGSHHSQLPMTKQHLAMNSNRLSQEDAQEFLGFFLDTIHEELLLKIEQYDKARWERASKGIRAGMDSLSRQSVNGESDFANSVPSAPPGPSNTSVVNMSSSAGANPEGSMADDDEWLEVGSKGRTATTRTTEAQESAVTRIFGGQLRSVLKCPGQKDSVTLEPFMSLQLEIQSHRINTVADALSAIAESETLSDVTNRQNLKVEATKQVFIETLPPVLILHLKRFIYDPRAGGVLKSHKIVSFETELDVPKECIAPAKRNASDKRRYRLQGVVYHHGKHAGGGHYTCSLRQSNGRWVNIDDTTITPISPEEAAVDRDRETMRLSLPSASSLQGIPEKAAYLLFYQRI